MIHLFHFHSQKHYFQIRMISHLSGFCHNYIVGLLKQLYGRTFSTIKGLTYDKIQAIRQNILWSDLITVKSMNCYYISTNVFSMSYYIMLLLLDFKGQHVRNCKRLPIVQIYQFMKNNVFSIIGFRVFLVDSSNFLQ